MAAVCGSSTGRAADLIGEAFADLCPIIFGGTGYRPAQ